MIQVQAQAEPATFDEKVRKKGVAYLKKKGIVLSQPLPPKTQIEPYWRECLTDLHRAYGGVCAYLSIFFERVVGGGSVDHFIAKSADAGLAYEWNNYRLACSTMNSRKREFNDVLDPFTLGADWFRLELSIGHIYANPNLPVADRKAVEETIKRLGLDDAECRELRARRYQEYLEFNLPADYLKRQSPFVWAEANRQGLL